MYYLIEDDYLLKNIILFGISDIRKEFGSEPVYNKKILKTNLKSYGDETSDFHNKETPKASSNHTSVAVMTIDSIL